MDPYLESPAFWVDFHFTFINYWREALADALPAEFEADIGERVYLVEQDPDARKKISPDISVVEKQKTAATIMRQAPGATAVLEPVTIPVEILDGPREAYIELIHKPERSLVAVLELLSPANKEQPGRTEYLQKRNALLYQPVHVVELDLLLSGRRLPMHKPLPRGDYHYFVCRAGQRPDCQVYSWNLRQPLPRLPVPLRAPYDDVSFDLAAVFNTAYDRGRFGQRISLWRAMPGASGGGRSPVGGWASGGQKWRVISAGFGVPHPRGLA